MLNLIKKQGIGTWIMLGSILLTVIALIIYGAALGAGMNLEIASGSQPFYEAGRAEDSVMITMVTTCGVLALVFLVGAIVASQFELDGVLGKVVDAVGGAMRIVAPALIMAAMLYFVYGSFTGLGWTFFSNEELVIYPEAVKVGTQVIAGLIIFAIAAIGSIVSVFFSLVKKADTVAQVA